MNGQLRRPAGSPRSAGGQFAEGTLAETSLELDAPAPSPWKSATPIAIDEALAQLYADQARLSDRHAGIVRDLRYLAAGRKGGYRRRRSTPIDEVVARLRAKAADPATTPWDRRDIERRLDAWQDSGSRLEANRQAQQPMHEFERRGGWGRAFLVTGSDGHVHSSMGCSTCNRGEQPTRFQWMTDFSGASESEIVDAAGWRACTVCFPTAPVGDPASLPTRMFSDEDEAKEAARAERAAAKAERDAKKIAAGLTADGSPLTLRWSEDAPGWDRAPDGSRVHSVRSRPQTQTFKTERSATQWLIQEVAWGADWDGPKKPVFDAIVAALATKHGKDPDDVRLELMDKIKAKIKRDR